MKRIVAVIALTLVLCGCGNTTHVTEDVENSGRFRSEVGTVNIITDTRTGVQYLVWQDLEKGGICVLVDEDGKPLLAGERS